jgi:hypothetical protein
MISNDSLNWWHNLPRPRKLMLTSIIVLFVSQFFMYAESTGYGILSMDAEYNTSGTYWSSYNAVGTGWQVHPGMAGVVIPLLALAYVSKICEGALWRSWGYLGSVILLSSCVLDGGQEYMTGTRIGFVAMAIAIWATIENRRMRINEEKSRQIPHHT